MKTVSKRYFALVLAFIMFLSLMPANAFAEKAEIPAGIVTGEELPNLSEEAEKVHGDRRTVRSAEELAELAALVNAGDEAAANASYLLTDDIDLPGAFTPIGAAEHPFKGSFDGAGKKISGLSAAEGAGYFGLFGVTENARLTRIAIENAAVSADGYTAVGAIVGWMQGGTLTESYVTGAVSSSTAAVGGLVGMLDGGTVENCYNTAEVNGYDTAGGVVGCAVNGAVIACCYGSGRTDTAVWKKQAGYVVGAVDNASVVSSYAVNGADYHGYIIRGEAAFYESSYAGFDFASVWTLSGSAPLLVHNTELSEEPLLNAAGSDGTEYRALLIGQQDYGGDMTRPGGVTAGYMKTALENTNNGWAITNRCNASSEDVKSSINSVFSGAGAEDINLFFFCGHGCPGESLTNPHTGELCCYDDSRITTSELAYWLSSVNGHFYVIIDTCGSGGFIAADSAADSFNSELIGAFAELDGRTISASTGELRTDKFSVLTACDYNEDSWTIVFGNERNPDFDMTKGYFLFTGYLLEAAGFPISGKSTGYFQTIGETIPGDSDDDEKLSFREAYIYADNRSAEEAFSNEGITRAHVQMYPENCPDVLFDRVGILPSVSSDEEELQNALYDPETYEVFVDHDLTINSDITIPQGKRLIVSGENSVLTVNGTLFVEGNLTIGDGCTVDTEKAQGFILGQNSHIEVNIDANLKLGSGYINETGQPRIFIDVHKGYRQAAANVDSSECVFYYIVYDMSELPTAKKMAVEHQNDSFNIDIRTTTDLYEEFPENVNLMIGCDWNNAESVTVTVPTDKTLRVSGLEIADWGNTLNVNGTLDVTDGHIFFWDVDQNAPVNTLNIGENGRIALGNGWMHVGWGSRVENKGTVTVNDINNIYIEDPGSWFENYPVAPNAPADEEGLREALTNRDIYTVVLTHALTPNDDLVIPEGKELYISPRCEGLTVPEGITLTVNGHLVIGGLLDASEADGLVLGLNGDVWVENQATLLVRPGAYHTENDWPRIDVDARGDREDLASAVVGLNENEYKFQYDVYSAEEFGDAITVAGKNSGIDNFVITVRKDMELRGVVPGNASLAIGKNWNNGSYVTAFVNAGDTLTASQLDFWDAGSTLVVNGTLNAENVNLGDTWDGEESNRLIVENGGQMNVDDVHIGFNTQLINMGEVIAHRRVSLNGQLSLETRIMTEDGVLVLEGVRFDASEVGDFWLGENSNVFVDTGSTLSIRLEAYDCPTEYSHIWVNVKDNFDWAVKNAVSGIGTDKVNYQYDAYNDAEFAAARDLARAHEDVFFNVTVLYTADLYGELPANVYLRLNNYWAEDGASSVTLTVPKDEELILHNNLDICGEGNTFVVEGKVNFVSGGLGIRNSSSLFVDENGSVTIGDAHLDVDEFASAKNNGSVTVRYMRNVHINDNWIGNPVSCSTTAATEEKLAELLDGDEFEVFVSDDFTIYGDITVPMGKRLVLTNGCTLTFTKSSRFTVEGEIQIDGGSTLDASEAEGFIIEQSCDIQVFDRSFLRINGKTYKNNAKGDHIHVIVDGGFYEAVTGVDSNQYINHCNVFSESELPAAISMAGDNPTERFAITARASMDVSGDLPGNAVFAIGRDWSHYGESVVVTVPEGKTLTANAVEIWDSGNIFVICGTLNADTVTIGDTWNGEGSNRLVVRNGGQMEVDEVFVCFNAQLINRGKVIAHHGVSLDGQLNLETRTMTEDGEELVLEGVRFDASDVKYFWLSENSNVWVDTGSTLSINPNDAYNCATDYSHISVNIKENFAWAVNDAVTGIDADKVNYQYDAYSDTEFAAAKELAEAHKDVFFNVTVCYTAQLSGEIPENVFLRLNNNWDADGAPIRLTVPAEEELILNNRFDICGEGNTLAVEGTLTFKREGLGVINGSIPNSLFVAEGGTVNLHGGYIYVEENAFVENKGAVYINDLNNVDINGDWFGNWPVCSAVATTEEELAEMLSDEALYEVYIKSDLTIEGDITIPQGKRLIVSGDRSVLTVSGKLSVEGNLIIEYGCTVDAENAEGFILGQNSHIEVNIDANLKLGSGYENKTGQPRIFIDVREGYRQAATYVDSSECVFYYIVYDMLELPTAKQMADEHPIDSFNIDIRTTTDLYEEFPENVNLMIGCDWNNNDESVTVTVPVGETLQVSGLEIADWGSILNVFGTLDVNGGHISLWDVGEDMPGNTLNVMEGGSVKLGNGSIYIGQGSAVHNDGTIVAAADSIFGPGAPLTGKDPTSIVSSGTCGENAAWTLDLDGTLTVSGTGAIRSYPTLDAPWASMNSKIKKIILKPGITSIGLGAFYGCTALTSVTFPDTLEVIGMVAFSGCTGLTEIKLPDSLTMIGGGAFSGCTGLRDVYYNATEAEFGLIEIWQGNDALMDAAKHFETAAVFTLPANLKKIDAEAFMGIPAEVIIVPAGVAEIASRAFADCPNLRKIIFLGNPTSIAEDYIENYGDVLVIRP